MCDWRPSSEFETQKARFDVDQTIPRQNALKIGVIKSVFYRLYSTDFVLSWFVPLLRMELGTAMLHLNYSALTFGLWQIIFCRAYLKHNRTWLIA